MRRPAGSYARRVVPPTLFSVFDAAERLGVSVRHTNTLLKRYGIPVGMLRRTARLPSGAIVGRRVRVLTPSSLAQLLACYAGLNRPGGH